MRMAALLVGTAAFVWRVAAIAAPAGMTDPLLGLSYDPDVAHFEVLPGAVGRGLPQQRLRWIYASFRDRRSATTYYITSSTIVLRADDGSDSAIAEPDFGEVLRVNGTRVEVLGVPDLLFAETALLPRAMVDALMRDAAKRYVTAFGGASKLTHELRSQGVKAEIVGAPLREALRARGVIVPTGSAYQPSRAVGAGILVSLRQSLIPPELVRF